MVFSSMQYSRWGLQQHYNNTSVSYTRLICVHVQPAQPTPSTAPPLPCETHSAQRPSITLVGNAQYRCTFSAEYAYTKTNQQENCLRGGEKEQISNTFKEAMSLQKEVHSKEAAGKATLSLEKRGVYELVPIIFVPFSQKVVDTRWLNKTKNPSGLAGMLSSPRYRLWWYVRPLL